MGPGRLPFGWTIGAGYVHEDVDRLDREFDGAFVRGEIVVPVSDTLALTAGVGYEDIKASKRDILRDPNGAPIISHGGELVPDPTPPRRPPQDDDGVMYERGVYSPPRSRPHTP